MLTRRMQRHLWQVLVVGLGTFLLVIGILLFLKIHHNSPINFITENDFYQDFEMLDDEFHKNHRLRDSAPRRSSSQINGWKVLNTSNEGLIFVKDILFVPKRKLPKGANIYKAKHFPEFLWSKINDPVYKLDNVEAGERGGLNSFMQSRGSVKNLKPNVLNSLLSHGHRRENSPNFGGKQNLPGKGVMPTFPNKKTRGDILNSDLCTSPPCQEYLSPFDLPHFQYCQRKAGLLGGQEPLSSTCRFRIASPHSPAVALASVPGSGADHLRRLLQDVTGLCTGSTTCDTTLRMSGYSGECLRSKTVLVVKTHQLDAFWYGVVPDPGFIPKGFKKLVDVPVFESAIFLVRNPYQALLEEWSTQNPYQDTNFTSSAKWSTFVTEQADAWQRMILHWLFQNKNHTVIVVRYEDLKMDTTKQIHRILDFLTVPYNPVKLKGMTWERMEERITLTVPKAYRGDQVTYVNNIIEETQKVLSDHPNTRTLNLPYQYLLQ